MNEQISGMITDIQKFSLHDGPGIRTTVFLKGCNMRCSWCHNPETWRPGPELMFTASRCIGCGACYQACQTGALRRVGTVRHFEPGLCTNCGACAEVCAPAALSITGRKMTVSDIMHSILLDKAYYTESGGGVTVSGGEPLMQSDFVAALLSSCRNAHLDTAIESNYSLPWETVEKVLPWLDHLYCDIKLMDDSTHVQHTGISNAGIFENLARTADARPSLPITVRTPLIPGITDTDENIRSIAAWLAAHVPGATYELLNYNPLAESKFQQLSRTYLPGSLKRLSRERMHDLRRLAESQGIHSICGGD